MENPENKWKDDEMTIERLCWISWRRALIGEKNDNIEEDWKAFQEWWKHDGSFLMTYNNLNKST